MDFSIGDDQYEIYNNNSKIRVLYEIKKSLIYFLVDTIIKWGDNKYKDFDIDKYYMNKIITHDIALKYDGLIYEENNDVVWAVLQQNGFEFVANVMSDKRLKSIVDIFNNNNASYRDSISALYLKDLIDDNILLLKKINTDLLITINKNIKIKINNNEINNDETNPPDNEMETPAHDLENIYNDNVSKPVIRDSFIKEHNNKSVIYTIFNKIIE